MSTTTSTLSLSLSLLLCVLSLSGCVSDDSDSGSSSSRSGSSSVSSAPQDVNYCIYVYQGRVDQTVACVKEHYSDEYDQNPSLVLEAEAYSKANKEAVEETCTEQGMCWSRHMTYDRKASETCESQVKDMSCERYLSGSRPEVCFDVCTFEADRIRSGKTYHEVAVELTCRNAELCLTESGREKLGFGSTQEECLYAENAKVEKNNLATQCEDASLVFDAEAAAECLTELESQSCDDFVKDIIPDVCRRVCK